MAVNTWKIDSKHALQFRSVNGQFKFKLTTYFTVLVSLAFLSFLLLSARQVYAGTGVEPPPATPELIEQLRKGGFVIYFRHATTELTGVAEGAEDLTKCETQRQLSDAGRELAATIGKAIHVMNIPIGKVWSSPFCRCKETAHLIFGRFEIDKTLYFALNVSDEERKRQAEAMRRMLATAPPAGTNTVIVSHSANLREATGIWPKPEGTAYIFKPGASNSNGNSSEAVAKILPNEWSQFASRF
ncbi:MAG: histidine phosphatase family protein [Burkholderiales bacterium]|nr:histidine phosphatase family protein [Burkholderiales bacterium]